MSVSQMTSEIKPMKFDNTGKSKVTIAEIEVVDSPCVFDDVDQAVDACCEAQQKFCKMPKEQRQEVIESIRQTARLFAEDFAISAWSETNRGRLQDKLAKQFLAANSTPGIEDLHVESYTGDHGLTMISHSPYGVVGAVTPVTNPTATIINNCITLLSGGNGVVFNPHPAAMYSTNRAVAVMNQAIVKAGGPACVVATIRNPTVTSGSQLLTHAKTAANLVTGGPAVVKVAMSSGKKSFCAGPGNPSVVVDETANVAQAAESILKGASFDNNMICTDEKQVFASQEIYDKLIQCFRDLGVYVASEDETNQLTEICIPEGRADNKHGIVDKDLVGQDADVILAKIGKKCDNPVRLIVCEVPKTHPLVWTEQLMPILPVVKVKDFEEACDLAYKSEYGYRHTASIYSNHMGRVTEMAKKMDTSLFIVNGEHVAGIASGGEGYTSFSIAGSTGEGLTRPRTFVRERRFVCKNALNFA